MDGNQQILQDQAEATEILKDLSLQAKNTIECVSHIFRKVQEEDTQKGISFLNVKCHMMISYLTNLAYVVLRKLTGKHLQGDAVVDRLVEIRTVLEKMRPIDQKLKYQIDKLMATVATGSSNADDPLRFKANPDGLINKIGDDNDNSGDEENETTENKEHKKSKVYAPPKLSAVYYEEDGAEKQQRLYERAKKRALSSSIMRELRQEYDEGPEEIQEGTNLHRLRDNKSRSEMKEYEEMNMIRLQQTKQMKHKSKELLTMSRLSGVAKFEDVSVLETNPEEFSAAKKKKKGAKKQIKKKSKKNFKKRKRF